ncbi:Hint domain-containing protein [Lentibacter algarum]|nr:Hint domain-containing protein [Lentibacter algarum]
MTIQTVNAVETQTLANADGFIVGSTVLTLEGEMPVEFLTPGDRVITRDSGMAVLLAIEAVELETDMVWIMGGSLGHNKPDADTLMPANQHILLRDWRAEALAGAPQAFAPAAALVDGEFIRDAGRKEVTLYKLTFEAPHILYVDGLELSCEPKETQKHAA